MKKIAMLMASAFLVLNLYAAKKADDFTLSDVNGKKHTLSDYKGKTVVLEWVNYDCPFVRKHYDSGNMQSLQEKYATKDVVWLSICSSAKGKQGHFSNKEIKSRIKEAKATPTAYLIDEDGKVGKTYGAKTTPHMYVIDPNGKTVYEGAIDSIRSTKTKDIKKADNYVAMALDALTSGKKIKVAESKPYGCSVKYN